MTTDEALREAIQRMDRARSILTDGKPTPDCNWGMLDTADLRQTADLSKQQVPKRATGWAAPKDRYTTPVLFNPYSGAPRDARDIHSDPQGTLIAPPGAQMLATPSQQAQVPVERMEDGLPIGIEKGLLGCIRRLLGALEREDALRDIDDTEPTNQSVIDLSDAMTKRNACTSQLFLAAEEFRESLTPSQPVRPVAGERVGCTVRVKLDPKSGEYLQAPEQQAEPAPKMSRDEAWKLLREHAGHGADTFDCHVDAILEAHKLGVERGSPQ